MTARLNWKDPRETKSYGTSATLLGWHRLRRRSGGALAKRWSSSWAGAGNRIRRASRKPRQQARPRTWRRQPAQSRCIGSSLNADSVALTLPPVGLRHREAAHPDDLVLVKRHRPRRTQFSWNMFLCEPAL